MNEQEHKTHYRKVFKSDHLGVADLEDMQEANSKLIFTISYVKQEYGVAVAGKKGNFNIAYFIDGIKPLVLNATNSKVLKTLTGSAFVEDWKNLQVQLYIDTNAKLKGEIVGGVRISPKAIHRAQVQKSNAKLWEGAKVAYKRDGNFLKILEKADISESNMKLIEDEVKNGI